jgi:predicted phosphodiesterase
MIFPPKRIFFIVITLVLLLLSGVGILFWQKSLSENELSGEKIGWLTDIHAGANKRRTVLEENGVENTLYPRKYAEYFRAAIDKMKANGINIIIATGDSTNLTEEKYAQELRNIEKEKKVKIIWVRGNHDFLPSQNKDTMPIFEIPEPYFYVFDTKNVRIIVLDSVINGPSISAENIQWIKDRITETNLPIIIASHTPLVSYDATDTYPVYPELTAMINASKKVRYVISGHLHFEKEKELDGVLYKTGYPLTAKDHLGSFYTIDLKNKEIKHYENYSTE